MLPGSTEGGQHDQLSERIRQLRDVIKRSEKHGSHVTEQIDRLRQIVTSMEAMLEKQLSGS